MVASWTNHEAVRRLGIEWRLGDAGKARTPPVTPAGFTGLGCRDSNPNYLIQSQASYR